MGGAGVAAAGGERVADGGPGDAELLRDGLRHARQGAGQAEMRDRAGRRAGLGEEGGEDRRHDLEIALVADPALLPAIVELAAMAAVMVDEIDAGRAATDEAGDAVAGL